MEWFDFIPFDRHTNIRIESKLAYIYICMKQVIRFTFIGLELSDTKMVEICRKHGRME